MNWLTRLVDKTGVFGTITAAMGCAACFPALGQIAAVIGLGFLAEYEGIFLNTLIPAFAWLVLVANILLFVFHQQQLRLAVGTIGPVMVLLTLYPLWPYAWSTYLFYLGLLLMLVAATWDLFQPVNKTCTANTNSTIQEA